MGALHTKKISSNMPGPISVSSLKHVSVFPFCFLSTRFWKGILFISTDWKIFYCSKILLIKKVHEHHHPWKLKIYCIAALKKKLIFTWQNFIQKWNNWDFCICKPIACIMKCLVGTRYLKLSEPTKDLFQNQVQDNHELTNANRNQHSLVRSYEEDRDSADK